jgi:hypothetical protein
VSWNGSGAFTRIFGATGWTNDKNSSVNILSSRHDTHDQDLADGINLCVTKDGQSKFAATSTPNLTNSYDWGSTALTWRNIYSAAMRLVNSGFYSSLTAGTLTANRTVTVTDGDFTVGPDQLNTQNTNYIFVLADSAKVILHTDGSSYVWTIPTNAAVAFSVGTRLRLINNGTTSSPIVISTGGGAITLYDFGNPTAISVSVPLYQKASMTIEKIATDTWQIVNYHRKFNSSFTATYTGFSVAPASTTCLYYIDGNQVTLAIPASTGTSSTAAFAISNLPSLITPQVSNQVCSVFAMDNGVALNTAVAVIKSVGTIEFYKDAAGNTWTGAGTKGLVCSAGGAYVVLRYPLT